MWQYYFIPIYVFVVLCFVKPKIGEKNKTKLLFLLVPLFVIAALRGNGQGDYFEYLRRGQFIYSFDDVLHADIGMEMGYRFLCYLVRLLKLPKQTVIVLMNLISFCCQYTFIKKNSSDWNLSVLMYIPVLFQFEMHAARTGVALSIVALGMQFIKDRKLIKYVIVILVASLFHVVAFIALILYFMYDVEIKPYVGVSVVLLDVMFTKLIGYDKIIVNLLSAVGLNTMASKFSAYSSSKIYGYPMKLYDPRILIAFILFVICAVFIVEKEKEDNLYINAVFIYLFLMIFLSGHTFIAYRVSSFFYMPFMLIVPLMVRKIKLIGDNQRQRIIIYYTVVIMFSLLNIVYASQNPEYILCLKQVDAMSPWY